MTQPRESWQGPRPGRLDRLEPEASLAGIALAALGAGGIVVAAALLTPGNPIAKVILIVFAVVMAIVGFFVAYKRLSNRRHEIVQVRRRSTSVLWWLFRQFAPNVVALGLLMHLGRDGRAILAEELTGRPVDFDVLVEAATTPSRQRSSEQDRIWSSVGPLGRSLLARALYLHGDGKRDRASAAAIYAEIEASVPPLTPGRPLTGPGIVRWLRSFAKSHRLLDHDRLYLAELQFLLGRAEESRETLARARRPMNAYRRLEADLINPFTQGGDMDEWLALVNRPFVAGDYSMLSIADGDAVPFERLAATPRRDVTDGPVVTVVVSSYKPGDALLASVRSIVASSWRNLEVLVVDDCSPKSFARVYKQVAAIDPRVRVERLATNGGTYACRNYALDHAAGELITFHDSDDWMHPERIERQAAHFTANAGVHANTTSSVRVTPDLLFTHYRTPIGKVCEPSLMFAREHMRELVGYFDTVRKAADSEYRFRIARATGVPVPTLDAAPLTFQRVDAGSLSGDEIHRDWIHVGRRIYRGCFEQWHGSVASPRFEVGDPRPCYAPPRLRGDEPPTNVDVVVAVPYALPMGSGSLVAGVTSAVDAALAAGKTVALWPIETPWRAEGRLPDVSRAWAALLNAHGGAVEAILPGDAVECGSLLVADAAVGEYRAPDAAAVKPSRVVLHADSAGVGPLGPLASLVGGKPEVVFAPAWADVPAAVIGK